MPWAAEKVRITSETGREQTGASAFVPHSLVSQGRQWAESWLHSEGSIGSASTDQEGAERLVEFRPRLGSVG